MVGIGCGIVPCISNNPLKFTMERNSINYNIIPQQYHILLLSRSTLEDFALLLHWHAYSALQLFQPVQYTPAFGKLNVTKTIPVHLHV